MSFGKYLRSIRAKKMSQRELARRIGVDNSYISKIENDVEQPPSEEILLNIARELKVDADKLILQAKRIPSSYKSLINSTPEISEFLNIIKDKEIDNELLDNINKLVLKGIKDSMKIKNALIENEKKYEIIFNNANDAIFLNKVDNNGMITNIIDANKIACNKLGYTKEELECIELKELFDKDFIMNNPEILQEISNLQNFALEIVCTTKTGTKIIFDISSHRFRLFDKEVVLTIARDITDKKHLSEAHKIYLSEAYKNLSESIAVLDKDYKVIFVNNSFQRMLGYNVDEIKGVDIRKIICTKELCGNDCDLCNALNQGKLEYEKKVKKKRKDGTDIYIDIKGYSIKYYDRIIGINIIFNYC